MQLPYRNPRAWLLILLLGCSLTQPRHAVAGGGPENVLLVVNPLDADSLTIANHFIQLRGIPTRSVFYLPWKGPAFETDIATFSSLFWTRFAFGT